VGGAKPDGYCRSCQKAYLPSWLKRFDLVTHRKLCSSILGEGTTFASTGQAAFILARFAPTEQSGFFVSGADPTGAHNAHRE